MANFFKGYGVKAYQIKHEGEQVEEIKTSNLAGCTAPDPKSLGNRKQSARNRAIYGAVEQEEENN